MTDKKKCPKTMSGKHIFIKDVFVIENVYYPKCELCGIINDLKQDDK